MGTTKKREKMGFGALLFMPSHNSGTAA